MDFFPERRNKEKKDSQTKRKEQFTICDETKAIEQTNKLFRTTNDNNICSHSICSMTFLFVMRCVDSLFIAGRQPAATRFEHQYINWLRPINFRRWELKVSANAHTNQQLQSSCCSPLPSRYGPLHMINMKRIELFTWMYLYWYLFRFRKRVKLPLKFMDV